MKTHARNLSMATFFIDRDPVTCGQYREFLARRGYSPHDGHNWLRNWGRDSAGKPTLPPALEMVPVTYVSFAEAASYCKAKGKRLPSTIEWQYAAQVRTDGVNRRRVM